VGFAREGRGVGHFFVAGVRAVRDEVLVLVWLVGALDGVVGVEEAGFAVRGQGRRGVFAVVAFCVRFAAGVAWRRVVAWAVGRVVVLRSVFLLVTLLVCAASWLEALGYEVAELIAIGALLERTLSVPVPVVVVVVVLPVVVAAAVVVVVTTIIIVAPVTSIAVDVITIITVLVVIVSAIPAVPASLTSTHRED